MTGTERNAINVLIAHEVMGFVFVNGTDHYDGRPSTIRHTILCPPDYADCWCKKFPDCKIESKPWAQPSPCDVPDYAGSMSDAWTVAEKSTGVLELCRIWTDDRSITGVSYKCHLQFGPCLGCAMADTAPLAICQAALDAVRKKKSR